MYCGNPDFFRRYACLQYFSALCKWPNVLSLLWLGPPHMYTAFCCDNYNSRNKSGVLFQFNSANSNDNKDLEGHLRQFEQEQVWHFDFEFFIEVLFTSTFRKSFKLTPSSYSPISEVLDNFSTTVFFFSVTIFHCTNDIPMARASLKVLPKRKSNSARGPKAQGQNWLSEGVIYQWCPHSQGYIYQSYHFEVRIFCIFASIL